MKFQSTILKVLITMSLAVCILLPIPSLAGKEESDENLRKGQAQNRKPAPKIGEKKAAKTNKEKIDKKLRIIRKELRKDTQKLQEDTLNLIIRYKQLKRIEKQVRKLDKKKKVHSK